MLYFAYGSNMSQRRLRERVPSAEFISLANLERHAIRFHKCGRDGSAKCDAYHTGDSGDSVIGVVFLIDPGHRHHLDAAEGLGNGYATKSVELLTPEHTLLEAFTYYATAIDTQLKPYSWYHEHVLRGCRENALPASYVRRIESIACIQDDDALRASRELAIYR